MKFSLAQLFGLAPYPAHRAKQNADNAATIAASPEPTPAPAWELDPRTAEVLRDKKAARDLLYSMHQKRKAGPQTAAIHAGAWALDNLIAKLESDIRVTQRWHAEKAAA